MTLRTYLGYEVGRTTYDGTVEAYHVQVRAPSDAAGAPMDTDESEAPEALPVAIDFVADPGIELDGGGKYVLLSTCDYMFKNARYVLHGKLVPLA